MDAQPNSAQQKLVLKCISDITTVQLLKQIGKWANVQDSITVYKKEDLLPYVMTNELPVSVIIAIIEYEISKCNRRISTHRSFQSLGPLPDHPHSDFNEPNIMRLKLTIAKLKELKRQLEKDC